MQKMLATFNLNEPKKRKWNDLMTSGGELARKVSLPTLCITPLHCYYIAGEVDFDFKLITYLFEMGALSYIHLLQTTKADETIDPVGLVKTTFRRCLEKAWHKDMSRGAFTLVDRLTINDCIKL